MLPLSRYRHAFSQLKLNEQIKNSLMKQAHREFQLSIIYTNLAYWYDHQSYKGTGTYFLKKADDERYHAFQIFDYISTRGHEITLDPSQLEVPKLNLQGRQEAFKYHEELELENFSHLKTIADQSKSDPPTYSFIQKLLSNQIKECDKVSDIMEKSKHYNVVSGLYYHLDNELHQPEYNFHRWRQ